MSPRLIGVSGRAGAGKDTIADLLQREHGFARRAFADPLRAGAAAIFGLTVEHMTDRVAKETIDPRWGLSPRQILQRMGTEAMRGTFGEDVWLRAFRLWLDAQPEGTRVVVPDTRFENEARLIQALGGVVWRVQRPGIAAVAAHASETALDSFHFDRVVDNAGSIDDLSTTIRLALAA